MIGGEGIAKELILSAIANGRHVVTANKALLAAHGNELFRAAADKGVDLYFEASVGGCMPIIKTLRESLVGNRISAMTGILNGTCNYILSKITDEGSTFEDALAKAQQEGYAEADPTLDVDGHDTAHKIAILSALAFGMEINLKDVYIEGISRITPLDIEFAGQFGYRIKLLAISKAHGGRGGSTGPPHHDPLRQHPLQCERHPQRRDRDRRCGRRHPALRPRRRHDAHGQRRGGRPGRPGPQPDCRGWPRPAAWPRLPDAEHPPDTGFAHRRDFHPLLLPLPGAGPARGACRPYRAFWVGTASAFSPCSRRGARPTAPFRS